MSSAEDYIQRLQTHEPVRQTSPSQLVASVYTAEAGIDLAAAQRSRDGRQIALKSELDFQVRRLGAVIAEGDLVAAEWAATGSSKDGTPYRNRNIGLFTVRDGKIVSVREYTDTRHAGQVFFPELG
jgi:ketosteroid isomerase-like protein